MRWLLFISRVALICNVCYVLSVIGRYFNVEQLHEDVVNTIVILGFVAVFLNILVTIIWLITVLITKKPVSLWLGIINVLFLVFQLLNAFYLEL
ncbi:MAG: hypothetical protein KF781_00925 [Chitinophagaceae bacterium]|nr:hypothetical protein [Chitinophagaceae bacterium]MCW5905298.1 hypothetical protein [Chitinophagaceae bacterium]